MTPSVAGGGRSGDELRFIAARSEDCGRQMLVSASELRFMSTELRMLLRSARGWKPVSAADRQCTVSGMLEYCHPVRSATQERTSLFTAVPRVSRWRALGTCKGCRCRSRPPLLAAREGLGAGGRPRRR